jgi:hypothetical protein
VTLAALLDHCIDHRNADAVTQRGGKGHAAGSVSGALSKCRRSSRPPMRFKNQENLG